MQSERCPTGVRVKESKCAIKQSVSLRDRLAMAIERAGNAAYQAFGPPAKAANGNWTASPKSACMMSKSNEAVCRS